MDNVEMKSGNKRVLIVGILALVIIALAIVFVVIKVKADPQAEYNDKMDLGKKYLTELDYEQAIATFEEALEIDPKNSDAYIMLAEAYSKNGDKEKAQEILVKAEKKVESRADRKKIEEKIELIKSEPDSDAQYTDFCEQGENLYKEGKVEEAIAAYEKAIDAASDRYEAYVGLFELYVSEKQYAPARIIIDGGLKEVTAKSGQMKLQMCYEKLESALLVENNSGAGGDTQNDPVVTTPELTPETTPEVTPAVISAVKSNVFMNIRQIDNSKYPEITVYTDITDADGEDIGDIKLTDIYGEEIDRKGGVHKIKFSDVRKVIGEDTISINIVVDKSGSMSDYNSMQQVKNAINSLISYIDFSTGDRIEIISFDDYVYLEQGFTSNASDLRSAVNGLYPGGMTALYDAIYSGLYQSYYEDGAKCVIAFTDGMENYSSYTYDDIVRLSKETGIPVYIVGVGSEYDANVYMALAAACGGSYYSAYYNDLESVLSDIYISLYREQQDYYAMKFNTKNKKDTSSEWTLSLKMSDESAYMGSVEKQYYVKADMSGAFSDQYYNVDYILDFSSTRAVTEADLKGLSLAQLRIARNEIFARHGRQFKDSMLNQWFYSKKWYLGLRNKYAPKYFDDYNPNPLSALENKNVNFIADYEKKLMNASDIFPNASYVELSGYDLALTKDVLKKALKQMNNYTDTQILKDNKARIQEVIDKENIKY